MTHADINDLETRDYIFKIGDRGKAIQARYDKNTDALIFPRAAFDYVYRLLKEPLSQEQKSGKWIDTNTQDEMIGEVFKCAQCGEDFIKDYNFNYCPNCGAKMENVEKSLLDIKREKAE